MAVYNEKNKDKWTKDGRHWYFRITYNDVKGKKRYYKSKKYETRELAEAEELKFKTKRDNPTLVKFSVVASEYLDYMYESKKESTAYSYENAYNKNIEPYFKDFYINNITMQNIKYWKEEMFKKNFKINYLDKLYNILKSIYDYAIRNYSLENNLIAISGRFQKANEEVIADEQKIRYITYEEFNQFVSVIDDDMWKTFFTFLYYTGMRKGEVQALTWNDINFNTNEITVNKTLSTETKNYVYKITSTKNYINRKIKMSKTLRETLLQYKNICKQYSDFKETWFVFGNSRFLPKVSISRHKKQYFKISGVNEITIHEFRHSHVSLLINEYVKVSKEKNMKVDTSKFFLMMSNRMGHSIDVMQKTYMHLFPTIQDEVVDLLDNL